MSKKPKKATIFLEVNFEGEDENEQPIRDIMKQGVANTLGQISETGVPITWFTSRVMVEDEDPNAKET